MLDKLEMFIAVAREGRSQLAEQMAKERQERSAAGTAHGAYPGDAEAQAQPPEDDAARSEYLNKNNP